MSHILVFSFMGLGDVVMFTPVLQALRAHDPGAQLSVVARSDTAPLLQQTSLADRVHAVDRNAYRRWRDVGSVAAGAEAARLLRFLRECPIDLGIIQDYSPFALWVAGSALVAGGARRRLGFAASARAGAWLTDRLPYDPSEVAHETTRYEAILAHLGIPRGGAMLDVAVTQAERADAQNFLRSAGIESGERVIGLHPGSNVALKRWPAGRFVQVAIAITEQKLGRLLLVGGASERETSEQIAARCRAVNAVGRTTVRQLVGLTTVMDVLITPDSGPMHVAAAVGTPTIALFGPTDPLRVGPLGAGHQVLDAPVPCGPCFRSGKFPNCPKALCLEGVEVFHVMDAVQRALRQGACPMLS
jgi:lipopolysaccharide heptosyltransferase I